MTRRQSFPAVVELPANLQQLKRLVDECQNCELYRNATQGVSGTGATVARMILVGEQPGNEEDLQGFPFVGPAGRVLDRALDSAGISRRDVYVTNAVTHFYHEQRGKIRLHKKPKSSHIAACKPWLAAEIELVQPKVIVLMGATAAVSVLGRPVRVLQERGQLLPHTEGRIALITIHPSMILRMPDKAASEIEFEKMVTDLTAARIAAGDK